MIGAPTKAVLTVLFVISFTTLSMGSWILIGDHTAHPADDQEMEYRTYKFAGGTFTVSIGEDDINDLPKGMFRVISPLLVHSVFITPDDPVVQAVWSNIRPHLEGLTDYEKAQTLHGFVNDNIGYISDEAIGWVEYSRFPAETLFYGEGDCEDMAYLLYTLYRLAGLDSVFIISVGHASVGVDVGEKIPLGNYVNKLFSDTRYYIADPTSYYSIGEETVQGDMALVIGNLHIVGIVLTLMGLFNTGAIVNIVRSERAEDRKRMEEPKSAQKHSGMGEVVL